MIYFIKYWLPHLNLISALSLHITHTPGGATNEATVLLLTALAVLPVVVLLLVLVSVVV